MKLINPQYITIKRIRPYHTYKMRQCYGINVNPKSKGKKHYMRDVKLNSDLTLGKVLDISATNSIRYRLIKTGSKRFPDHHRGFISVGDVIAYNDTYSLTVDDRISGADKHGYVKHGFDIKLINDDAVMGLVKKGPRHE